MILVGTLAVLGVIGIGLFKYRFPPALPANGRAPLYVAEFTNSTGDSTLNLAARSIVANELNRSPAVQVLPTDEYLVAELLQHAGKGVEDSLTPELARQSCERDKGRFFTDGEIKPQGNGYTLELSVRECGSGRTVAQQRGEASNKDDVLRAASELATAVRLQLSGSSANPAGNAPLPLPTAFLSAYSAYLWGARLEDTQHKQSAVMFRRATQLDPNFAEAWYRLSTADLNLHETDRSADDLRHAFALREKINDLERGKVEARYYLEIAGEIYKAIEVLQAWEKLEPDDFAIHNQLGIAYAELGMFEKATAEFQRNADLFPTDPHSISNFAVTLFEEGRYDEAATVMGHVPPGQALGAHTHAVRYELATLRSDQATLTAEHNWMEQNADERLVIAFLARIDLHEGRLENARQRTEHGVSVAAQSGMPEAAADMLLNLARGEALYGEGLAARQSIAQALKLANSRQIKQAAASIMIFNGQEREAQEIIQDLTHDYPTDTFLNDLDAPLVLAASQLSSSQADSALHTLDRVKPFEFGAEDRLRSNYLRALTYLRLQRPEDASGEFNAVLAHRGVARLSPVPVLSQLGLARAYALRGENSKSRAAYKDFLTFWKDADPDVPIYKAAKAEYAKLQ